MKTPPSPKIVNLKNSSSPKILNIKGPHSPKVASLKKGSTIVKDPLKTSTPTNRIFLENLIQRTDVKSFREPSNRGNGSHSKNSTVLGTNMKKK